MARHHLFVCVVPMAFGEMLQARRVAEALVVAGDRVSFVAPAEVQGVLAGAPIRCGILARFGMTMLDEILAELVAQDTYDSVCLVDLTAFALAYGARGFRFGSLRELHPHVVALDLWNLAESSRIYDVGSLRMPLQPDVLELPRLVPVPFARPSAASAYDAWPASGPLTPAARAAVRAELGIESATRVLVMPTASWQEPAHQQDAMALASALAVPPLVLAHVARSGATLVHVGPVAWAEPSATYRHLAALPSRAFQQLVGAADALLTANLSATSIATALAAEVPVVAFRSAGRGAIAPFCVWPLGLCGFLDPVLAANPLLDCVRVVELFDEDGLAGALAPDASATTRVRAYRDRVHALPGPAARYAELI